MGLLIRNPHIDDQPECTMIISNREKGLEFHYTETGHRFSINAHTLECICLECKHEILDLKM